MHKSEQKQIGELKKEIERLKKLAYRDELTRAYNRQGFKEEVKKFLKEVSVYRERPEQRKSVLIKNFSLAIFDLDDFKHVNDTYGHSAGDKVLQKVTQIIQERVRSIDLVARWGGEEILLGLIGASEEEAYGVVEDIRERVSKSLIEFGGKKINVTVSGGVATLTSRVKTFEDIFDLADKALYKAKKEGKNRIVRASEM